MKQRFFLLLCAFSLVYTVALAQNVSKTTAEVRAEEAVSAKNLLVQGYDAYSKGDWNTALFFFRKAVSTPNQATEESWFMLIMSEMYSGDYAKVESDGNSFCTWYPQSEYKPNIKYQMGRARHLAGDNDKAVMLLSEFCHEYPSNELYPSALFWIAECFYEDYNFTVAKSLYERIVKDFYLNAKAVDAQYRIETISQREREEKLLYLLKVTGEEYLSTKEEYEKQLREYQTEELFGLRKQVKDLSASQIELQSALEESQKHSSELEKQLGSIQDEYARMQLETSQKGSEKAISQQPSNNDSQMDKTTVSSSSAVQAATAPAATAPSVPDVTVTPSSAAESSAAKSTPSAKVSPEIEALKSKAKELQQLYDKQESTKKIPPLEKNTEPAATDGNN